MSVLYAARHGQTNKNKTGSLLGRTEKEINETGILQANELGKSLKDLNIELIISSSMVRAKQTAEIVNTYIHKEILVDPRLVERNMGAWEGMTFAEMNEKYQKGFDSQMAYDLTPPGGESAAQVQKRVFEALDDLKKKAIRRNVLLVSHSYALRIVNKYFNPNITAEEFFEFSLKNCEVRSFYFFENSEGE